MKKNRAFTLIELLVVIAIIGGLSAIILPNFMGARESARDVQRKSDLKQIQGALELYKLGQNPQRYPTVLPVTPGQCWSTGGTSCNGTIYMNKFPYDPATQNTPTPYYYRYNDDQSYTLCGCLENLGDSSGKTCGSGGNTCPNTLCGSGASAKKCYVIEQQ